MPAVGRGQRHFSLPRDLGQGPPQQCAPNLQCPLLPRRKSPSGEENGRLSSLLHWSRTEVLRHLPDLLSLLGGGSYPFGSGGKGLHGTSIATQKQLANKPCRFAKPERLHKGSACGTGSLVPKRED